MKIYFPEWNASYEKIMLESLKKNYPVIELTRTTKHYNKINKFLIRKNISNYWLSKIHAKIKFKDIGKDDVLICNGFSILGFIDMVKQLDCTKVLIIRDTIEKLNREMREKKKWLKAEDDYVERVRPYFSKIYSFDLDDCNKYNFVHLPQFLPYQYHDLVEILSENKRSAPPQICYFVGEYNQYRKNIIDGVHQMMEQNLYTTNFYLVDKKNKAENYPSFCKNVSLTYDENIELLKKSEIILEINNAFQEGTTLRAIEALFFDKKLITTNKAIKMTDLYHPDRVFIWGEDDLSSLSSFLQKKIPPVEENLLKKYCSDSMLDTILKDIRQ